MIAASIVLYNTPVDKLKTLLECVEKSIIDKLYLIDNSEEPTLAELEKLVCKAEYHFNGKNLGYGAGHNIAIRYAVKDGYDYHIILNPDIYWNGEVITFLKNYMDSHTACGLCMPKILYPDGSIQFLCKLLPRPIDLLGRRFIPLKKIRDRIDARYELHSFNYNQRICVPSLSGCFMFLRIKTLKQIGMFDERYFMYAEDLDLCRRIGEVGSTMFIPDVSVYHEYEKGSYHNKKLLRLHVLSIIKYFNKWGWLSDKTRKTRNQDCLNSIKTISDE